MDIKQNGDLDSMEMDKYFEGFIEKSADDLILELKEKRTKNSIINSKKQIAYV